MSAHEKLSSRSLSYHRCERFHFIKEVMHIAVKMSGIAIEDVYNLSPVCYIIENVEVTGS